MISDDCGSASTCKLLSLVLGGQKRPRAQRRAAEFSLAKAKQREKRRSGGQGAVWVPDVPALWSSL